MARIETADEVKSELELLIKRRDAVKEQIKNMQITLEQDVERRMAETRKATSSMYLEAEKLKKDKSDFELALSNFKKEKMAFDIERQKVDDMKDVFLKKESHIGEFVRLVKSAAERL